MLLISRDRLVLLAGALAGLALLTGLQAEDKAAKPAKKETPTAVKPITPKPLSAEVRKGLAYLIAQQRQDGGWGQGGGWRTNTQGNGRIEGKDVADPSDVGNTAISLLALLRAGNTPMAGPYATNVARGIEFIRGKVEKADAKSLSVTDVQGTQLQSKIGTYVDTFLTALVLAEVKGKMPNADSEKQLVAALDKTVSKIEKNQNEQGHFAGNTGWASVISLGLANKAFNRVRQVGGKVSDTALKRAQDQVASGFDGEKGTFRGGSAAPLGGAAYTESASRAVASAGRGAGAGVATASGRRADVAAKVDATKTAPALTTDAGVPLYSISANVGNLQDIANTNGQEKKKAQEVLARKDSKPEERKKAELRLKDIDAVEKRDQAVKVVVEQLNKKEFVAGFGNNGGEEFLSFMNISETLLAKGGTDWEKWDKTTTESINRVQDKDGSWSGQHCITGKTFCTSAALLVLMADRAPLAYDASEKKGK